MLLTIIVVATAIWVGVDASNLMKEIPHADRIKISSFCSSPVIWILGTLLLWIVAFPWYLATRGKYVSYNLNKAQK